MKKRQEQEANSRKKKSEPVQPAEKPVSLAPLSFEEAVADLLKVKPDRGTKK